MGSLCIAPPCKLRQPRSPCACKHRVWVQANVAVSTKRGCKHKAWLQACSSPCVTAPSLSHPGACSLHALSAAKSEKLAYLQGDSMQPAVSGAQRRSPER